ncbi:MAG: hypothetical protein ACI4OO_08895 [Otoolea sp.]
MIRRNHRYAVRKAAFLFLLAVTGACMMTGCKKKEKINPSTAHTTAAAETMAETSAPKETSKAETTEAVTVETETKPAFRNITAKKNTYSSGKVKIEYPSVVNMEDTEKAKAIDELLKANALAVIKALELDESRDSVEITCQVMSADRNRITVVYKGSCMPEGGAHPTNLFYTSTVDVQKVENIRLSRLADPYTMAGYVLSDDCQFPFAEGDAHRKELMEWKNTLTLEQYTEMFENADFPIGDTFPESFSYEYEGNIYFSIPVSHALGDYAIVMFSPSSK